MDLKFNLSRIFNSLEECIKSFYEIEDEILAYITYTKNITNFNEAVDEIKYVDALLSKLETIGKYLVLYELEASQTSITANIVAKDSKIKYDSLLMSLKENINLSEEDLEILALEYPNFVKEIKFNKNGSTEKTFDIIAESEKATKITLNSEDAHELLKYKILKHYEEYKSKVKKMSGKNPVQYSAERIGLTEKQIKRILDIKSIRIINAKYLDFMKKIFKINDVNQLLYYEMISTLEKQSNKIVIPLKVQLEIIQEIFEKNYNEKQVKLLKNVIKNNDLKIGGVKVKKEDELGNIIEEESNETEGYVITIPGDRPVAYIDKNENINGMHILIHEFGHLIKENEIYLKKKTIEYTTNNILEEIPAILNQILLINNSVENCKNIVGTIISFLNYVYFNIIELSPVIMTEMKIMKTQRYDIDSIYEYNLEKLNNQIVEPSKEDKKLWSMYSASTMKLKEVRYAVGIIIAINIATRLQKDKGYLKKYENFLAQEDLSNPLEVLKTTLEIDLDDNNTIKLAYNYIEKLIDAL